MTSSIDVLKLDETTRRRLNRSLQGTSSSSGEILFATKELKIIETYIKLTSSIKVTLVPANDMNLDKKEFTWSLKNYDEEGFKLQVDFENPKYISFGGTDTLKMTL